MPYIQKVYREVYRESVEKLADLLARQAKENDDKDLTGHLNFVFCLILAEILKRRKMGYKLLSSMRAALEDASAEFYRRVMVPYEDRKIEQNGDVF